MANLFFARLQRSFSKNSIFERHAVVPGSPMQPKVITATLPTELYRSIVDHISHYDRPTLLSLLITSKELYAEAIRRLYDQISFDSTGQNQDKSILRQRNFYATIAQSPSIAHLVHGLDLSTGEDFSDREYWLSLAATLRALQNLKKLVFWYTYSIGDPVASILEGCTFQIESFTWSPRYADSIIPFLESQPLINHLSLRWDIVEDPDMIPLSPSALPVLRTLAGGQAVIEAILPRKKHVTHLHWIPELDDDLAPDMSSIGPALSSIRVLYYGSYFAAPSFQHVVGYLQNLEVLHWYNGHFESDLLPKVRKIVVRSSVTISVEGHFRKEHIFARTSGYGRKSTMAFLGSNRRRWVHRGESYPDGPRKLVI